MAPPVTVARRAPIHNLIPPEVAVELVAMGATVLAPRTVSAPGAVVDLGLVPQSQERLSSTEVVVVAASTGSPPLPSGGRRGLEA